MGRDIALPAILYDKITKMALLEDLGQSGDLTTRAIVTSDTPMRAALVARRPGIVAGLDVAVHAFHVLDREIKVDMLQPDGRKVSQNQTIATLSGSAQSILAGERTALNFLCRLSGIATATSNMVHAVSNFPTRISCTRKTTPGFRALEKYAVRVGGGINHRTCLSDAILVKDNHIALAGSVEAAMQRVRTNLGHLVKVEIEVDSLAQLQEAMRYKPDAVLLDNMSLDDLKDAVKLVAGRAITEASGNITLERAPDVAATGVDVISIGWLTHSGPALDIGLDYKG